jgi:predicted NUDIX family phosphoesterase
MTETLVCLAAEHIDSLELPDGFTSIDSSLLDRLLLPERLWLGPRSYLETDERFRQLVSYVVFRHASRVLVYRRASKGGESRLHGLLSLGVGGHVNASDLITDTGTVDLKATLHRACSREIAEEVHCDCASSLRTIGVIKESANPVSRVHLGVVVECRLELAELRPLDPALGDARFVAIDELPQLSSQMETWSCALITPLSRLTG